MGASQGARQSSAIEGHTKYSEHDADGYEMTATEQTARLRECVDDKLKMALALSALCGVYAILCRRKGRYDMKGTGFAFRHNPL